MKECLKIRYMLIIAIFNALFGLKLNA